VIEAAAGRIPVIATAAVRRGTDIFKALALGASASAWAALQMGVSCIRQPGVEAVLEILRRELKTIMRQAGTISVDKISRNTCHTRTLTAGDLPHGAQRRSASRCHTGENL